nr:hypothetical protein [Tanacetum cinerariifolium]
MTTSKFGRYRRLITQHIADMLFRQDRNEIRDAESESRIKTLETDHANEGRAFRPERHWAFLVTADVPEIYMQEFWATATVHHHAIRFKMDNKKHIVNLESFRDMLHICPRVYGQTFVELPFEEEILAFIRFLGHSAAIRTLTDVNINKLYHLRLSQAQILWGLYHKRNVDYAYLMWEDFVYQAEHKNHKKSNEMYYPRFTKVIIHHFMSKDPSIPRRNKVNWHYIRDDHMCSTIKLVSRHQNTTRSSFDTSTTPPNAAACSRLTTSQKGKQVAKASKANSLYALSEVAMTKAQQLKLVTKRSQQQTRISYASVSGADEGNGDANEGKDGDGDEEDDGDDGEEGDGDNDDEDDDGKEGDDNDDDQEVVRDDEEDDEKDDEEEGMESIFETTSQMDAQTLTSVAPLPMTAPTMTPSTIATITTTSQAPILPTTVSSTIIQNLPNFGSLFSFDNRLRTLEANFSESMQTNQFAGAVSAIPGIINWTGLPRRSAVSTQSAQASTIDTKQPRIIAVTELKIVEWHNYKHLDWITVRKDDDKLYKFKEGDFKRLHIQDIKDMLLLLVQGKLTNLTVEECFAFNVSLRMFTRSIVIQRRVKDLQLGVEIYKKKLNLTKLDSYRSDLKRKEAYIAYSNPR